ncbi:MAG TPA: ABC transporter permease, partial [Vicinamibacterales bacterium]
AITNTLPAGGSNASRTLEIEGHPAADPIDPPWADYRTVTASYFETLRIPIEAGRGFTAADREGAALVAVISRTAAAKYWPGEDPIGRRVRIKKGEWMTVVGVCGDIIQDWFAARNAQTLYRPVAQAPVASFGIVVRTPGDPTAVGGAVRQALLRVDSTQPVFEMMSMRRLLSERTIGLQFLAAIMTVFAALALLLASVGLYAVIAYLIAQRRHEIGLRMALGASGRVIVGMTMAQALKLTLVGAGIGLVLSVALSRVMEAGLLGIASGDATIFAVFAAVLIGTALVAGYLPARRAAAVDPMTALRSE